MEQEMVVVELMRGALAYARGAMWSLILISGGAAALLFVGAVFCGISAFASGMLLFFVSALMASGAMGVSYLSEVCFVQLENRRWGEIFQRGAILMMALSPLERAFGLPPWRAGLL